MAVPWWREWSGLECRPLLDRCSAHPQNFFFSIYLLMYLFIRLCGLLAMARGSSLHDAGSFLSLLLLLWSMDSSCSVQALEHAGSVVVGCGLSCSAACGILVPQPGTEPTFPAPQDGFPTTGPPGKSPPTEFNCIPFLLKNQCMETYLKCYKLSRCQMVTPHKKEHSG